MATASVAEPILHGGPLIWCYFVIRLTYSDLQVRLNRN